MDKVGNYSKARLEVQDDLRLKKRFPYQSPSTIPRFNKAKGSKPKPIKEKGSGPYV